MRCDNCGYKNVSHASKCIKCNESFGGTGNSPASDIHEEIKGTVRGQAANSDEYIDKSSASVASPEAVKAEKAPAKPNQPGEDFLGTINPYSRPKVDSITFQPISREGEESLPGVEFKSDNPKVELNRSNLDPSNPTITRGQQASLEYDNGNWKIKDQSKTGTFLKITESYSLKDGDKILMGDRLFTVSIKS